MTHHTTSRRVLVRLAAAGAAVALMVGLIAASPASATIFNGTYLCNYGPYRNVPIAGAAVGADNEYRPSEAWYDVLAASFPPDGLDDSEPGLTTTSTDGQGDWLFDVPQQSKYNYDPFVALTNGNFYSGGGDATLTIDDYPNGYPWQHDSGWNRDDTDFQNYGAQIVQSPQCAIWVAMKRAYERYARVVGAPPDWSVRVHYGAPSREPMVLYTTVYWPFGFPPSAPRFPDDNAELLFALTMRDRALSANTSDAVRNGGLAPRGPHVCQRTDRVTAFTYGWAEFYAANYAPAPFCPGRSSSDMSVEGNVAAALGQQQRSCPYFTAKKMIQTLFAFGSRIRTLADFFDHLSPCGRGPLVTAGGAHTPAISVRAWVAALSTKASAARARAAALAHELPGAVASARGARCSRSPCLRALALKLGPGLLTGQIADARLQATTLSALVSRRAQRQSLAPTAAYLMALQRVPITFDRGLGRIGVNSISTALRDARVITAVDHTAQTRLIIRNLGADRAAFARARATGSGLPFGYPIGGQSPIRAKLTPVPTVKTHNYVVSFNRFPDGTVVTTQTAGLGATFGSAQSLGFPGTLGYPTGSYLCPAGPTVQGGVAVTPTCPAPGNFDVSFSSTGTMARLISPAQAVSVTVGATVDTPGGAAAYVYGYDAAGKLVSQNAAAVGAASQGQSPGLAQTVRLTAGRGHSIRYVALYFAEYSTTGGPQLMFNNLAYAGP